MSESLAPDLWFVRLLDELGEPEGGFTSDERRVLLDLARIAAHTSERWTAPISTYLAGLALAAAPPGDRVARLRAIVDALEPPA